MINLLETLLLVITRKTKLLFNRLFTVAEFRLLAKDLLKRANSPEAKRNGLISRKKNYEYWLKKNPTRIKGGEAFLRYKIKEIESKLAK